MAKAKSSQKKETKEAAVQEAATVQEGTLAPELEDQSAPADQMPEVPDPEPAADIVPDPEPEPIQEEPAPSPEPPADPDLELEPSEPFVPYTAKVGVPLLVLRRVPDPENKPIGTLHHGMKVEVVDSRNGYAKLKNGTWVNESHLERQQ